MNEKLIAQELRATCDAMAEQHDVPVCTIIRIVAEVLDTAGMDRAVIKELIINAPCEIKYPRIQEITPATSKDFPWEYLMHPGHPALRRWKN
jgi:hypothetical protein